ncbi:MAG: hypothetical protein ACYCUG_12690, partial [Acidimicrobiales bacterium]
GVVAGYPLDRAGPGGARREVEVLADVNGDLWRAAAPAVWSVRHGRERRVSAVDRADAEPAGGG